MRVIRLASTLATVAASGSYNDLTDKPIIGAVFTKSFESTQQTITSGGSLTLAHGLGGSPRLYLPFLKCVTTDLGYAAGDEVAIAPGEGSWDSNHSRGISMIPDATNITIRFGSDANPLMVPGKTTGTLGSIAPANWKLIVRAWV
jgi:hypothetical protein